MNKTKKELIENLIKEGVIGLEDALLLLEADKEVVYVNTPYLMPYISPLEPYYIQNPYTITCTNA